MVAAQRGDDVRLDVGNQLGDVHGVGELGLLALGQRALDVLAAVLVDAGNGQLQAADVGDDLHVHLLRVLVRHQVGGHHEVLALVDDAVRAGATGQLQVLHLAVAWKKMV